MTIQVETIPIEIRESARAVLWNREIRDGSPTKVPYQARCPGRCAAVDAPETWATFNEALDAVLEGKADGLGFVLGEGIVGIDLDKCRDPETGAIEDWALSIVRELDSYTEVSPSETGVHVLARGDLPPGRRKKGRFEMYSEGRYFTVTGRHLEGTSTTIEERSEALAALHALTFANGDARPQSPRKHKPVDTDDAALLERARQAANGATFSALWAGDTSRYPSASEADLALCNLLAFWTGADTERIDRLFRESGLLREKWDARRGGATYGEQTIARAVADCRDTYRGACSFPGNDLHRDGENEEAREPYTPKNSKFGVHSTAAEAAAGDPDRRDDDREGGGDEHFTDLGNARRLVADHGADLRYVAIHGHWYVFDGARFARDETGEATRRAQDTVRRLWQQALDMEPGKERDAALKHAMTSESEPSIRRMLALTRAQAEVAIASDALDAHPQLLATPAGTVELSAQPHLRPARREDLLTRSTAVGYDPQAEAPRWRRFLDQVLPDAEVRAFVQRAIGYSVCGNTTEHVILILWGTGANGKSTLLETLLYVLGDYASNTPTETLLAKRETSIPNDLAALRGVRLVTAVETGEGRRLAESKIKALTGGDTISARFMRGEWFTFRPQFVVWLATNHKPEIRGTDLAIWRRIRLVPFKVTIPESEMDRDLPEQLRAEAAGILRWAVEGAAAWYQHGLAAPEAVLAATDAYRADQDVLAAFLDERCIVKEGLWCSARDLFHTWTKWCEAAGEHAGSQKRLGDRLRERGFEPGRTNTERTWRGVGLKSTRAEGDR